MMISVIQSIAQDILTLARMIADKNGLQDSALRNDIEVKVKATGNPVIEVFFNGYIDYIEAGRKPRTGEKPPVSSLRDWAISKGLPADNETLYAISEAIRQTGYAPRPVLAMLEQEMERNFEDKWADRIFESVMRELEGYFRLS